MKNTLMFLLVSLLLSFSLTACGGDSQNGTTGRDDGLMGDGPVTGGSPDTGSIGSAGTGSTNGGTAGSPSTGGVLGGGQEAGTGSTAGDALDNAGRDIRNAAGDVGTAVDRAMDGF